MPTKNQHALTANTSNTRTSSNANVIYSSAAPRGSVQVFKLDPPPNRSDRK